MAFNHKSADFLASEFWILISLRSLLKVIARIISSIQASFIL